MKKLNIISLWLLSMLLGAGFSCKKFVDIGTPKNQLTTAAVFADSTNANAAISGIYVDMMQVGSLGFSSGGITLYPGLSSDEFYLTTNDVNGNQFYNNNILATNGTNQSLYDYAYKYIYESNACIEGVNSSQNISTNAKNAFTGEATFIRAFIMFNLVNLYGPVPIITSTDYNKNRLIGRSSTDLVYAQIIADLKYAQNTLPNNSGINYRASYYSATALLAKTYLYTGQYALASEEADKIINSGNYSLEPNLDNVFLASSTETIWSLLPVVSDHATWEGFYFVPSSPTTIPKYIITNSLYKSFETGDQREVKWIGSNTVSGQVYPFPYKYKVGITTSTPTENSVVFRLAEVYLISAEAKANSNDLTGSIADLNIIRNRAGLPSTTANDKLSLLLAIEKERQVELFCEWGNRWFDLKRTNRATVVLSLEKKNWNTNGELYPIPLTEITANPTLTQNAGY